MDNIFALKQLFGVCIKHFFRRSHEVGWAWAGECFFWYRPTRVVPDKRPLNGCCCCSWPLCIKVDFPERLQGPFKILFFKGLNALCYACSFAPSPLNNRYETFSTGNNVIRMHLVRHSTSRTRQCCLCDEFVDNKVSKHHIGVSVSP